MFKININMLTKIQGSNISYTGKSFKFNKEIEELSEFGSKAIEKGKKKLDKSIYDSGTDIFKSYANIETKKVRLEKKAFGYAHPSSIELPEYKGPIGKNAGLSTETGGYGGGYLISNVETPLSTTDIHTCAGLNLVDNINNKQLLFHVYHNTAASDIEKFLKKTFPTFDKANIVPGDQLPTNNTVNNILEAINNLNSKAKKIFYHFSSDTPEVVAHKGSLSYVKNQKAGNVSFKEVDQYFDS